MGKDEKNKGLLKGLLKGVVAIVTWASGATLLGACNGEVTTNKGASSEETLTVSEIYDKNNLSLDTNELLVNEAEEIASTTFGESAQVKFADLDENGNLVVIAYADDQLSSVVVDIPKETAGFLVDDVKETAIGQAGYTSDQKFKENEEAKVRDKINSALDYIESQIGKISELPTGTVNYYVIGESKENLDKTFSVISPVREDGTNVLFTVYENGDLTESVIKINDVENMTTNEIWEAISQGDYEIISQNELDPSSNYEEPPVEETVSFDDIYNQVFGEGFVVPTLQTELENLNNKLNYGATGIKLVAVEISGNEFVIYSEAVDGLGRTRFMEYKYNDSDLSNICSYTDVLKSIDSVGGIRNYSQEIYNSYETVLPNSENYYEVIEKFEALKNTLQKGSNSPVGELNNSNFDSRTVIINTNASLPASSNAFGEALLEDMGVEGNIISTYVGDMGAPIIDQGHVFDAGYISIINISVVYGTNDGINIDEIRVTVPVYSNERGDTQAIYQHVLNEGESGCSLQNRTTIEKNMSNQLVKAVEMKNEGLSM